MQYQPTLNAIYETDWLAADAYQRCSPESIGSQTSEEEFRWAMSVSKSRFNVSGCQDSGTDPPPEKLVNPPLPFLRGLQAWFEPPPPAGRSQVVHSRTFGSSSQQQGAEVHMLVPLVDLVNHAGDRGGVATSGGSRAAVPEETPQDIAAWELVRSQGSAGEAGEGEWEMLLKALQPLEAGQEVRRQS